MLDLHFPTTFGYQSVTQNLADPQEMVITEPGGHERYADRHTISTDECRYVDDGTGI